MALNNQCIIYTSSKTKTEIRSGELNVRNNIGAVFRLYCAPLVCFNS